MKQLKGRHTEEARASPGFQDFPSSESGIQEQGAASPGLKALAQLD